MSQVSGSFGPNFRSMILYSIKYYCKLCPPIDDIEGLMIERSASRCMATPERSWFINKPRFVKLICFV